ncbi:MAG: inositol monophosphatase [Opitutales bacterium]|nr:inositol monophosphatase [Opitutales bacterium]
MNLHSLLETAIKAARTTGTVLKNGADRQISLCDKNDVKLAADLDSEQLIRRELAGTQLPVFGEELGGDPTLYETPGAYYWVVDPLDGTFNYQRGQPLTCVSIGLMCGDKPVLGVIYNFNAEELYAGIVGEGMTLNGNAVVPAWANEISQACLMTGFPALADKSPSALMPFIEEVGKFKKIRMIGTAALAVAYVACGRADVYSENNTNLWDVAAGMALVLAAGGHVKLTPTGKRALNFNLRCAANAAWL